MMEIFDPPFLGFLRYCTVEVSINRVSDYAFLDVSVSPCFQSILNSEWSRNLTIILTALFLSKAFREVPDKDHRFSVLNI